MDRSRIAPEFRRPLRAIPPIPLQYPFVRRAMRRAVAALRPQPIDGVSVETVPLPGVPGASLRLYRPVTKTSSAALLWVHGGGMVFGSAAQNDPLCGEAAKRLGILIVSVDYRLAPENPFPAPLDDCHAAWRWLGDNAADLGVDPARVAVGGESAGGGLAASLVQRLHDEGVTVRAQWLFYPMLDDRTAARRELDAERHRVWNNKLNAVGWSALLDGEPGRDALPPYAAAARRDDLAGLPPTWIGVGDIDLFHDEDLDYARRLREAGVAVTVRVVPGAPHGFNAWAESAPLSRAFTRSALDWLEETLDGD